MSCRPIKVAILDMYHTAPNQGKQNIKDILETQVYPFVYDIFDVRGKCSLPGLQYDIYIGTGGPGSPLEGDGIWDNKFFELLDELVEYNKIQETKKYIFLICHSFQMACNHFKLGTVTERHSTSFGIFPVHKTEAGQNDLILAGLPEPFFVADTRNYQVIEPNYDIFAEMGAKILCREKIREHVDFERAIMAIRFSNEFYGTQFHPEADAAGMMQRYRDPEHRQWIIDTYGQRKYEENVAGLNDPEKISLTSRKLLPTFLKIATRSILGY